MKARNIIGGILALLLVGGVVGSVGYLSKGFKDFDYKTWFAKDEGTLTTKINNDEDNPSQEETGGGQSEDTSSEETGGGSEGGGQSEDRPSEDTRQNLRVFSFANELTTSEFTSGNFVSFLNDSTESEPVIDSINKDESDSYMLSKVYNEKTNGIRLGSRNAVGSFSVKLVDGFTFNRLKVTAVTFTSSKEVTKEDGSTEIQYTGDNESKFKVNDLDTEISLLKNEVITESTNPTSHLFEFDIAQDYLSIIGTQQRPCILGIEMWTE
ncbi:MAG: hypothetical protein MJ222_01940 [Bacilli bacterium]|nr:hypothetical protein [Bacilli bacterium]